MKGWRGGGGDGGREDRGRARGGDAVGQPGVVVVWRRVLVDVVEDYGFVAGTLGDRQREGALGCYFGAGCEPARSVDGSC